MDCWLCFALNRGFDQRRKNLVLAKRGTVALTIVTPQPLFKGVYFISLRHYTIMEINDIIQTFSYTACLFASNVHGFRKASFPELSLPILY